MKRSPTRSATRRPWGPLIRAGAKGLLKSLLLSAVLVGPGFLLMAESRLLGMVWVMAGSFVMMAWSYRRPWRLMWVTCLIPPVASILSYLVQLALLGGQPALGLLVAASAIGLFVGFYRGRSHSVYEKDGVLYARRTVGYLLAWLLAYGLTQLFAALGQANMAEVGRIGGGFTTAMLAAVSLVLLTKFQRLKRQTPTRTRGGARAVGAVAWLIVFLWASGAAVANPPGANEVIGQLLSGSDIDISANRLQVGDAARGDAWAERQFHYTWNVQPAPVERNRFGHVNLSVRRFDSSGACLRAGQSALAELQSRRSRSRALGEFYGDVERLSHGDLSFAWQTVAQNAGVNAWTSHSAAAYAGRWYIRVKVGNGPQRHTAFGVPFSNARMKVIALKALNTAYGRLRGLGLGGERDPSWWSVGGAGAGGVSPRQAAEVAAVIAIILIAAGVSVSVANSVATAVAESLTRATQEAAEQAAAPTQKPPRAPRSPPPEAPSLPPLMDPYSDTPLRTNAKGQYQDPVSGEWIDRAEAEIRVAELDEQYDTLKRERAAARAEQARQRERDHEDFIRRTRERDDLEREREATERAAHEGRMRDAEKEDFLPTGEMLTGTQGWDDTQLGWWTNLLNDSAVGAGQEILDLPNQAARAATAAWGALTNLENLTIAKETIEGIEGDFRGAMGLNPRALVRVGTHTKDATIGVAKVAGVLAEAAWEDPGGAAAGTVKAILGVDNWEKVIDGDRDLLERLGRALWGAVDTGGTLFGAGAGLKAAGRRLTGTVLGGTDVITDLGKGAAALDRAGEGASAVRAARAGEGAAEAGLAAGKVEEAAGAGRAAAKARVTGRTVRTGEGAGTVRRAGSARGAAQTGDATGAGRAASKAGDVGDVKRGVEGGGDAALAGDRAGEAAGTGRAAGQADGAAVRARGAAHAGDTTDAGRVAAGAEDAGKGARAGDSPWHSANDPEGYLRDLPDNALVDQNLLDGAGYSGPQMDGLRKVAREGGENGVIVGTRTTNMDSMTKIRDGIAVEKPLTIKSKTIGELDVYLGAQARDKGLVGHFRPKKPVEADLPPHLRAQIMERYNDRMRDFVEHQDDLIKLVTEGKVVLKDGKVYKVMGEGRLMPYAGDIDAVYFRDAVSKELLTGDEYLRARRAFMESGAAGQHGAETNLIADLLEGKVKGTPEYEKALRKAEELHVKLSKGHLDGSNIVLEMHPDGHFRRAKRLADGLPIAETYRPPPVS